MSMSMLNDVGQPMSKINKGSTNNMGIDGAEQSVHENFTISDTSLPLNITSSVLENHFSETTKIPPISSTATPLPLRESPGTPDVLPFHHHNSTKFAKENSNIQHISNKINCSSITIEAAPQYIESALTPPISSTFMTHEGFPVTATPISSHSAVPLQAHQNFTAISHDAHEAKKYSMKNNEMNNQKINIETNALLNMNKATPRSSMASSDITPPISSTEMQSPMQKFPLMGLDFSAQNNQDVRAIGERSNEYEEMEIVYEEIIYPKNAIAGSQVSNLTSTFENDKIEIIYESNIPNTMPWPSPISLDDEHLEQIIDTDKNGKVLQTSADYWTAFYEDNEEVEQFSKITNIIPCERKMKEQARQERARQEKARQERAVKYHLALYAAQVHQNLTIEDNSEKQTKTAKNIHSSVNKSNLRVHPEQDKGSTSLQMGSSDIEGQEENTRDVIPPLNQSNLMTEGLAENSGESTSIVSPPATLPDAEAHDDSNVRVILNNANVWKEYVEQKKCVVVTLDGRYMTPFIDLKIVGLQPHVYYRATLHLEPVDGALLQFDRNVGEWICDPRMKDGVAVKTEPVCSKKMKGTVLMSMWRWSRVRLYYESKVKKANEKKERHVGLNMRVELRYKYVPVMTIFNEENGDAPEQIFCSSFPECQFITVSRYMNLTRFDEKK